MKRRSFLKKTGLAAAGAAAAPVILPSGRLFAASGRRMAEHVVMVAFAGGVRQQESILRRYVDDSQGEPYPGNIMYNLLSGESPIAKIVYGTGVGGINPIPALLPQPMEQFGTTFAEVSALSAGHYGGLNSLVQGGTPGGQGLKQRPLQPTIFEYLRRHGGYKATDTWFVGNGIGGSLPLLNHSEHPDYGAEYAGNFFAPTVTFTGAGDYAFSDAAVYHPENELDPMRRMKAFLDQQFEADGTGGFGGGLNNTDEEKEQIKQFMELMYDKVENNAIQIPPVTDNGDTATVGFACEVMSYFQPAFTFVNLGAVDSCHSNFSSYLRALHRADHAVGHLWNHIQSIPEMAGNTTLILTPECGRNLQPNNILDENDWRAYDHSDENSMRIWTMMAGPDVPEGLTIGGEDNPVGMVTDTMMTVCDILGVMPEVQAGGMVHPGTDSLFNRI